MHVATVSPEVGFLLAVKQRRNETFHNASEAASRAGYEEARAREVLDRTTVSEVERVLRHEGVNIGPVREQILRDGLPLTEVFKLGKYTERYYQEVSSHSFSGASLTVSGIGGILLRNTKGETYTKLMGALHPDSYPSLSF